MAETGEDHRTEWMLMFVLTALTVLLCAILVRIAPIGSHLPDWQPVQQPEPYGPRPVPQNAVTASVESAGTLVTLAMDDLNIDLSASQPLDDLLPDPVFKAEFDVVLEVRRNETARIGAEHFGGHLVVMRGRDLLFSDYADPPADGEAGRVTMSDYIDWSRGLHTVRYRFNRVGTRPARLRPLWQPFDADEPQPLPLFGAS